MSPATLPLSFTTVSFMMMTLPALGSVTTLTSAQISNFGGQAQGLINAKLSRLYTIPITAEIPLLQTICTDIGIYNTLTRRLFTQEQINSSPWPDRYKEALDILDQIADGTIPLVDASGAILTGQTNVAQIFSTTKGYTPTFHEGPWTTQVQDEDKIEDELDKRDITFRDRLL